MRIRIGINPLLVTLRGIERQTKFGTSQALNELVEVLKLRAIDALPKYFRIRSQWLGKGFRTGHAVRDKLEAWVGHKDAFLEAQQLGGDKAPGKGGEQGIPQPGASPGSIQMPRGSGGERPTYRGSNWPKQLINAVKQFETKRSKYFGKKAGSKSQARALLAMSNTRAASNRLVFLKNAAVPTIAIRIAPGGGRGKYLALWFLKKAPVHIPKRWRFYEDAEAFAKSNFQPMMDMYVTKALNNMRTS